MNTVICIFVVCLLSSIYEASKPVNYGALTSWDVVLAALVSTLFVSFFVLSAKLALQWSGVWLGHLTKRKVSFLFLPSLPIALFFAIFAWIQVDYALQSTFRLSSLRLDATHFNRFAVLCVYAILTALIVKIWYKKDVPAKLIHIFGVAFGSAVLFVVLTLSDEKGTVEIQERGSGRYPNIVILSSDAISANALSFYGNDKETTPFLDSIKEDVWFATNFYPNANKTHGSIASMYTGKTPNVTGITRPPGRLLGQMTIEHLPFILKKVGYENHVITTPHHANPTKMGIKYGFDFINREKYGLSDSRFFYEYLFSYAPAISLTGALYRTVASRYETFILDRPYIDPLKFITEKQRRETPLDDDRKIEYIIDAIKNRGSKPVFVHVHLMLPHGRRGRYYPGIREFSVDENQDSDWMLNFYLDTVKQVDRGVERAYRAIEEIGELDNTLFIFTSDHGMKWMITEVPLIVRFPQKTLVGKVEKNRQLADLTPSILEYLQIETNIDFSGIPMFEEESVPVKRNIVIANKYPNDLLNERWGPPLYQIYAYRIKNGDHWRDVLWEDFVIKDGKVVF